MVQLDRNIILQTLNGYYTVNRITEAERRARLKDRNVQESLSIFVDLYTAWRNASKRAPHTRHAMDQLRLETIIKVRHIFENLARQRGLIE
jgi:hypothetical protein